MDIVNKVTEMLTLLAEARELNIVDITYKREGNDTVLRVLLDKEGGITVDECGQINNDLSQLLDRENIINEHYILEVSSPGLDRPLKTEKDFKRAMGKTIRVSTYAPIDGNNVFSGKLLGLGPSSIVVEDKDGISTEIPLDKIAKAKLEVIFK